MELLWKKGMVEGGGAIVEEGRGGRGWSYCGRRAWWKGVELLWKNSTMQIISILQETERRRKAEVAAHAAMNGPRVRAFEYAGPDFEVSPLIRPLSMRAQTLR